MAKVLELVRWFLRPFLDPDSDPRIFKYFSKCWFASFAFAMIANVNYMAGNGDLTNVAETLFVTKIFVLGLVKFIAIVRNKQHVVDIFESLQVICEQSE